MATYIKNGKARRRTSRTRRAGWNPSGVTIFNLLMLAFFAGWLAPSVGPGLEDMMGRYEPPTVTSRDALSAQFGFCHSGGGTNCVVDGDTFWLHGQRYRIADIDTPETHGPRCAAEGALGARATGRLQDLLNAGPFTLESADRDVDRYGRRLRVVTRGGTSIGGMLVDEGMARPWEGSRRPWC